MYKSPHVNISSNKLEKIEEKLSEQKLKILYLISIKTNNYKFYPIKMTKPIIDETGRKL